MTAKEVWEKMQEECRHFAWSVCYYGTDPMFPQTTPCAFDACPLLKGKE